MSLYSLKLKTAGALKWNLIDRLSTQVLYALTGIILARTLSQEDFGLVGAILVFQAFASLLVESGFSSALIQRKSPGNREYSTVFWFNFSMSVFLYAVLWLAAPLIALCFGNNLLLIPLSRVMFLCLILNSLSIVQANRLMKQMNVRPIAATNAASLFAGGVTGIYLALDGYGAWSIVWQTIVTSGVKAMLLFCICRWWPSLTFSVKILKGFFKVGSGIMAQSFLNTLFQNIYSFFIGNRAGMAPLGYYTQADKWSKMGITSISQTLTSSFLPTLSAVQDSPEEYEKATAKMNRLCAYVLYPFTLLLIIIATPVFHALFEEKWDASILLFQMLLVRGVFFILTSLYNNFLLSKAHTAKIVRLEILRDSVALAALFATLPFITLSTPDNPVYGIALLIAGQLLASGITWLITLIVTARTLSLPTLGFLSSQLPALLKAILAAVFCIPLSCFISSPWLLLASQSLLFAGIYILANLIGQSEIQKEVFRMIHK